MAEQSHRSESDFILKEFLVEDLIDVSENKLPLYEYHGTSAFARPAYILDFYHRENT